MAQSQIPDRKKVSACLTSIVKAMIDLLLNPLGEREKRVFLQQDRDKIRIRYQAYDPMIGI